MPQVIYAGGYAGRMTGYGWIPVVRKQMTGDSHSKMSDDTKNQQEQQPQLTKPPVPQGSVRAAIPWLQVSGAVPTKPVSEMTDEEREAVMRVRLNAYTEYVKQHDRLNNVIELLLTEARDSSGADGGTFYVVPSEGRLRFAYFQNDTMSSAADASAYMDSEIAIDERSICGYAAKTASILNIRDAYAISDDEPYSFNSSYDNSTGYKTVSLLTIPVLGADGAVTAVLQLVNKLDERGHPTAFTGRDAMYARMLAAKSAPLLLKAMRLNRGEITAEQMSAPTAGEPVFQG